MIKSNVITVVIDDVVDFVVKQEQLLFSSLQDFSMVNINSVGDDVKRKNTDHEVVSILRLRPFSLYKFHLQVVLMSKGPFLQSYNSNNRRQLCILEVYLPSTPCYVLTFCTYVLLHIVLYSEV
jgi:hypothetical protein